MGQSDPPAVPTIRMSIFWKRWIMNGELVISGAIVPLCMSRASDAATVSFHPERSQSGGKDPGPVAVEDFNRDSKRDLAVVN